MRGVFAHLLRAEMGRSDRPVIVCADVGFGILDGVREAFPARFFNVGAAEQAAAGLSVGLALSGKIPVFYTITPFLLGRPFEFWRLYLGHEGVPVKLVGSGRGGDYAHNGFTHSAADDEAILRLWPNVEPWWPADEAELADGFTRFLFSPQPAYLNLRR